MNVLVFILCSASTAASILAIQERSKYVHTFVLWELAAFILVIVSCGWVASIRCCSTTKVSLEIKAKKDRTLPGTRHSTSWISVKRRRNKGL